MNGKSIEKEKRNDYLQNMAYFLYWPFMKLNIIYASKES